MLKMVERFVVSLCTEMWVLSSQGMNEGTILTGMNRSFVQCY